VPNLSHGGAIDPTEKFLYLALSAFDSVGVAGFALNNAGGISEIVGSPFNTDLGPREVAIDPSGRFAYVANENANDINAYKIDQHTGKLTEIAGSPFPAAGAPFSIAADPSGKFIFVGAAGIRVYKINQSTGALSEITGSPFQGSASTMAATGMTR
jgi:6-phosphogluconolactonase (cycloisomerase 2 family)